MPVAQEFKVRIVSGKELARVARSDPRYINAAKDPDDVAGFADPQKGVAYVRNTHITELNKYLVNHEFAHLLEEKGTDEDEHGIRFKKGKDLFRNIGAASLLPVTAPFGVNLGTQKFREEVGQAIPRELSTPITPNITAVREGVTPAQGLRQGLPTTLAGAGVLAGGPLGLFSRGAGQGVATATGAQPSAPGGTALGVKNPVIAPQASAVTSGAPSAAPTGGGISRLTSSLTKGLKGVGSFLTGGGGGGGQPPVGSPQQASAAAAQQATGQAAQKSGLSLFGLQGGDLAKLGIGAGLLGLSRGVDTPEVPSLVTPRFQQLEQQAIAGEGPFGGLARADIDARLQVPIDQQIEKDLEDIKTFTAEPFRQQRDLIRQQFKQFQPGADVSNSSSLRNALAEVDRQEALALAGARSQVRDQVLQQRRFDVASRLGVDENTLKQLVDVAQLEVSQISTQLGIDVQQASELKQQYQGLAFLFTQSALGTPTFGLGNFNIGVNP